ncbi:MAG TPA: DNA polymerase III subunit gamma/tau [Bacteroidales bacterium]|nr:DNA polymerase III subunit gamma/tau [Bacteroidales bacterium]
MDSFIVSARKYRPATFDTVVGQKSITNTLKNAIRTNHVAQAFLFTGPRGVGKTTCARILAKTINCEKLDDRVEACNQCIPCREFDASNAFNVHELDAASNNSVEGIRNLVEQVRIPPQIGKYKVYIIDEVHMLSNQAFNAFLKTLEEPPKYAKFILATTEKHKIIPTILSRCQIFDFARITVDDIVSHLQFVAKSEGVTADRNALHIIAQKADGALRDSLSIFDQMVSYSGNNLTYKQVIENLNVLDYDYYFKLTDMMLNGKTSELLILFNEIIYKGFDGSEFLTGFGEHLRNLLICQHQATIKLMEVSGDLREQYLQQAKACSPEFLLHALEINSKADLNYKESSNKRLTIELALLQMAAFVKKKALT